MINRGIILKDKKYYEAYDERYKIAHKNNVSWSTLKDSPIVMEVIKKYNISIDDELLEIGCGEGRDSKVVLDNNYHLLATDISNEAISYCQKIMPEYSNNFQVLDCLSESLNKQFDFIYAIAVIHMLVLDEDRDKFYQFIYNHLRNDSYALICSMGDGEYEMKTDINEAFDITKRNHSTGNMMVTTTSCRMVSFDTFEKEIIRNNLKIIEKGITSALGNFNSLMYVVVSK